MAIDTVFSDRGAYFLRRLAKIPMRLVMTTHAVLREQFQLTRFIFMRVVAGETGHFALPETLAGRQHPVLVAMYIDLSRRFLSGIDVEIVRQPVAGLEPEGGFCFRQSAAVTQSAKIELLFT